MAKNNKSCNNHFFLLKILYNKNYLDLVNIGTNEKLRFWIFQIFVKNYFWRNFEPVNWPNMTPDEILSKRTMVQHWFSTIAYHWLISILFGSTLNNLTKKWGTSPQKLQYMASNWPEMLYLDRKWLYLDIYIHLLFVMLCRYL